MKKSYKVVLQEDGNITRRFRHLQNGELFMAIPDGHKSPRLYTKINDNLSLHIETSEPVSFSGGFRVYLPEMTIYAEIPEGLE